VHAVPFGATVLGVSLAMALFTLRSLPGSTVLNLFVLGLVALGALLSSFSFWLGLGFSQRVPNTGKSALFAAVTYFFSFNVLRLFGGTIVAQWFSFGILLAVPFVLGVRWPEAWSRAQASTSRNGG